MNETHEQTCRRIETSELGYVRTVCAECGSDWPCALEAQRREDALEAAVAEVTQ